MDVGNSNMGACSQKLEEEKPRIVVYTDGASQGNPGAGGAGIVMVCGNLRKELGIALGKVTNNIAELMAIKIALEKIKNRHYPICVYTDSEYTLGVLTGTYKAHKNQQIIQEIRQLMGQFDKLILKKVPGHAGVRENERADFLATQAAKKGQSSETYL